VLDREVGPGEVAVFRFPVALAAGSRDVRERFTLAGPSGAPLECPCPSAELAVALAGGREETVGSPQSVRARSCASVPLPPVAWLACAWWAARRRKTLRG